MNSGPIIVPRPPDPTIADGPPRRVVMLIYPGVTPLDISGPASRCSALPIA